MLKNIEMSQQKLAELIPHLCFLNEQNYFNRKMFYKCSLIQN